MEKALTMRTYEVRCGRLFLDGLDLLIRGPIIQAGLASYAARSGVSLWPGKGSRVIPQAAADEILALERRSILAILEVTLEDEFVAA